MSDTYKVERQKDIAIESIQRELTRNSEILKNWKTKHLAIRERLGNLVENDKDSLKLLLETQNRFDLGILTNGESLMDAILTKTAWETAKSTSIISEFDFETTEKLTEVYAMQEVIIDKTLMNIVDFYFESETHDIDNLDKTLVQFQLRFSELTGQESLLDQMYTDILDKLQFGK